jgi:hypothetical protein
MGLGRVHKVFEIDSQSVGNPVYVIEIANYLHSIMKLAVIKSLVT